MTVFTGDESMDESTLVTAIQIQSAVDRFHRKSLSVKWPQTLEKTFKSYVVYFSIKMVHDPDYLYVKSLGILLTRM